MKRFVKIGIAIVAVLVLVPLVVGLCVSPTHEATCRIEFRESAPATVWNVIGSVEGWSDWNSLVDAMKPSSSDDGVETWIMVSEWGEVPARIEVRDPAKRLVVHLDGGGFEGRWDYRLSPLEGGTGCTLEITEQGRVSNPIFRAIGLFMDEHESLRTCMRDLAVRLGDSDARPQIVREPNA